MLFLDSYLCIHVTGPTSWWSWISVSHGCSCSTTSIQRSPWLLILAMVTTIMCAIINLLSLAFGIPALVLSAMVSLPTCIMTPGNEMRCMGVGTCLVVTWCHWSFESLNARNKDYPQAKNYGRYSLMMTVLNIFFTLGLAMLITSFAVGCTTMVMAALWVLASNPGSLSGGGERESEPGFEAIWVRTCAVKIQHKINNNYVQLWQKIFRSIAK